MQLRRLNKEVHYCKMETFVFDANVPIAFAKAGLFEVLKKFFNDKNKQRIIMSKINFDECKSFKLKTDLTEIPCFNTETDVRDVKQIKDICEKKLRMKMSQRNEADYQVMALAIQLNANYLVTNDTQLFRTFEAYRNQFGTTEIKRITSLTLSAFLRYIKNEGRAVFENTELAKMNFDMYEMVETPRCLNGYKEYGWTCSDVQAVFRPYAKNVSELIPAR